MGRFIIRRLLVAIPTMLIISLVVFAILNLAPGDPTAQLPLTVPAEIREKIRESLGLNDPFFLQWLKWVKLMMVEEPIHLIESTFNTCLNDCVERVAFSDEAKLQAELAKHGIEASSIGDKQLSVAYTNSRGVADSLTLIGDRNRIISWSSRSAAMDTVYERLPQTLWVLGLALIFGVLLAVPVGTYQAYKQYSWFDNFGTVLTMIGFSVPVFVIGPMFIWVFSSKLGWLPTFYKTTHEIDWTDWSTVWFQIKQLLMPVTVLTLFNAAQFGRFARASVLENLHQDYVRTARAKGVSERSVINKHVLRNSLIPIVTLLALSIPGIFGGAIITENIFRINGLGQLLLASIGQNDLPMVQSLVFIFAVLTVIFNIVADVLYGLLDPRIRYD